MDTDSVLVTVQAAPEQPAKPAGPTLVDIYEGNSSTYLTTEFPGLNNYDWVLDPETAGTVNNNGNEAVVEWDMAFTGQVELKVMADNDCGSSIWSDSLLVTVTNTTGIGDLEQNLGVAIYPNPNKGVFTLELEAAEQMYVNIYIFNSSNSLVYQLDNLLLTTKYSDRIDLSKYATGVYNLHIESKNGKLSKQVIVGE